MRKNVLLGLITATLVVFGSFSASALSLDANIGGIFTDSSLSTLIPSFVDTGDGNATADLTGGGFVLVNITVENAPADAVAAIFATLTFQGQQTLYVGGNIPGSILTEAGFGGSSLGDVGTGGIKGNSPNQQGEAGDVWQQGMGYAKQVGTTGTGPDTISLLYMITGATGNDFVGYVMGLTAGDAIADINQDPIATSFDSAFINVPEPGTALLMGLGLAGLAGAGRRRS
jgi:hypothetical protein